MNSKKSSLTSCRSIIALVAFVVMLGSGLMVSPSISAAGKKNKVDMPEISCGSATQASLNIVVCAPAGSNATGLPAGFSIQWQELTDLNGDGVVTCDDAALFVWPSSDDSSLCKASFSGNASGSRYNILPGECVTVNIGEFLFDNGASTSCPDALHCYDPKAGTGAYVFRAFGHATSTLNRSDFTGNRCCTTKSCDEYNGGCTFTQGYWKTHGPEGCATGNNTNVWPVNSLILGSVEYKDVQLCNILNTPAGGNGLIALAHQLIAAKLNIANGAAGADVAQCISAADAIIGGLVIPPVGSGFLAPSATSDLTKCLTNYNEGATGPGHCQ